MIGTATTLLATLASRKSTAETVDLHAPDNLVPVIPPTAVPDLPLRTLDGAQTSLRAFLGKPLVLNFWATWCIPCVAELPELDTLAATPGITVLAVSADRSGATVVKPFLAKHPLAHATILLDPQSDAAHALEVIGFPTTLVIDPTGHLRARLEGPAAWSAAAHIVRKLVA